MPASPNAMTTGHGTSSVISSPADVQWVDSNPVPSIGIPADFRSWTLIALVLAIALLLRFSIAATLPLVEPTEGRYAQISQEMAVSGDWVTPRLWIDGEHIPFLGKPPLFFWSAAQSIRLFGSNELAVRLPSLIAAAALLILMYGIVGCYLGRKTASSATMMTVASPLFFGAAGTVILDLHLTFFVAGALLAYLAFALESDPKTQRRWSLAVFVLLAGGFLTKGPVAIVLFGLPVFLWTVLCRKWRILGRHAWLVGIPVFILIVTPWFVLAELKSPGFLRYFFVNENFLRYLSPEYGDLYGTGHRFPLGSAALMFLVATLPWSSIAAWMIFTRRGSDIRKTLTDDVSLFLFLGFAASVVFWCFARQLLATYLLPAIPLFAAWAARVLPRSQARGPALSGLAASAVAAWVILLAAAGPVASNDSTREVLDEALEIARHNHISGRVVFAGRTPYSATFYNPGNVAIHPDQSFRKTLNETIDADEYSLLILRESDVNRVPPSLRQHLRPATAGEHWLIFVPPTTAADTVGDRKPETTDQQAR